MTRADRAELLKKAEVQLYAKSWYGVVATCLLILTDVVVNETKVGGVLNRSRL